MRQPGGVRRPGSALATLAAALALAGAGAPAVNAQDGYPISGVVDGLYPGAELMLDARVTNPYPFTIRVIATGATVLDASRDCPAAMLEVDDSPAAIDVPPGETGSVRLHVRMSPDAPDACQGATWPLAFNGTAVRSGTSKLPETGVFDPGGPAALVLIGAALTTGGLILANRRRRRDRAAG